MRRSAHRDRVVTGKADDRPRILSETSPAAAAAAAADGGWGAILAAMCAVLVGIGLARFAYTPLVPALIAASWLTPAAAAYLGAGNLVGYLAGALGARRLAARIAVAPLMRGTMLAAAVSFFACAVPLGFGWFLAWRLLAGLAGGVLMVVGAPSVLPLVSARRRGLAGGVIFTGVGLGIAASGSAVPSLLRLGVGAAWLGLGALALALTLAAWRGWPRHLHLAAGVPGPRAPAPRALKALYLEYGLNAVGQVPHMIFLADFVARGLGQGIAAGAHQWVLFGAGAVVGPTVLGRLADRIGFVPALRIGYALEAAMVGGLALLPGPAMLALSSLVVGAYVPGITTIALGRAAQLAPAHPQAAWSVATICWALGQAAGAYALSLLFAASGSHALLFAAGSVALVAALAVNLAAGR